MGEFKNDSNKDSMNSAKETNDAGSWILHTHSLLSFYLAKSTKTYYKTLAMGKKYALAIRDDTTMKKEVCSNKNKIQGSNLSQLSDKGDITNQVGANPWMSTQSREKKHVHGQGHVHVRSFPIETWNCKKYTRPLN